MVGERSQSGSRADCDSCDQIVSTSVAQSWEGVVLGANADPKRSGSGLGQKRSLQTEAVRGHLEASHIERVTDPFGGTMLLPCGPIGWRAIMSSGTRRGCRTR